MSDTAPLASPAATPVSLSGLFVLAIKRNKLFAFGLGLILLIALLGIFAPVIAPHDPYLQNLSARTLPPFWHAKGSWVHPLGTDQLGRDYLSRTLYGARISLLIGISVALIGGVIGTCLGMSAGYFGGRIDEAVTFITSVRLAVPVILVALAVVALLGGSLVVVVLVLGCLKWDRFAVVIRSVTQQISKTEYITAARTAGGSHFYILTREILPNLLPHLVVIATIEAASAILLEASLSFLGLGVQPPLPSWGLMISEAKRYIFFSFWLVAIPGAALATLVLAINLAGDGLRDLLSPGGRE